MAPKAPAPRLPLLFAVTIGLGAFLLFQVQFILGKQLLPWFGGAPAVWTTCMLFFQLALLGGYAYAHGLARAPAPRQRVVHLALLGGAALLLLARALLWPSPITPSDAWRPDPTQSPIVAIALLLGATIGLPFLVLAATGPLLQSWFARTCPGTSPYRLYALSNLGSLLGLGTYPFAIEPALAIAGQGWLWSAGFGAYALLCGALAVVAGRAPTTVLDLPVSDGDAPPSTRGARALWFTLAAIASTLLLAVTTQISLEVAVIPFLWMLPLALYLLTFILCFEKPRLYNRGFWIPHLFVGAGVSAAVIVVGVHVPALVQLAGLLYTLFAYCMVCHGELARRQPPPRELTAYYLLISAGGAAGGIFTGVVAPLAFLGLWELPIALVAGAAVTAGIILRLPLTWLRGKVGRVVAPALAALILLGLTGTLIHHARDELAGNLHNDRGFFGTLRVDRDSGEHGDFLRLRHGRITHGVQFVDPDHRHTPNSYYAAHSGIGLAADYHPRRFRHEPMRIGVIGLGTGTIATYGQVGDQIRFYEIDPKVVDLSSGDDPFFTYLSESAAEVSIVVGDARQSLERKAPQRFDVLAVDAFSSDSIPAHLITLEAIELYVRHLRDDEGVIALHISNRYLDLDPLARGLAERLGLHIAHVGDHSVDDITWANDWMLLTRDPHILGVPTVAGATEPPEGHPDPYPVWTDTRSDLLDVLKL